MQVDIPGALHDPAKVADRIAALLEWEKLAQQERGSRALPTFQLRDHDREDIADLYGGFLNLSMSIKMSWTETELSSPTRNAPLGSVSFATWKSASRRSTSSTSL